ncbi:D-alanine--poly(phosphoribitol) ligase subunit DltC [Lactobacillus delbrueckii subsp. lactis]|jgi:D-alanine--poly(phosphoribitol) ligase subunit 2|uniref:D-alanyl carrier protein n=1 Tax=Lactobacillus delbrueckii TaxID=1584 RepID=A0ABD0AHI9_9LACO|nr:MULTISPECIES: D-alanine--poly(phosphoribitol) ligase subunit DltC [Lactobacillus]MCD5446219.1 D-alanine--poly(phosphoribitol) ligase subunit DltC [Lactobacillus delbrueckii subsp. lactis]MCD5489236.1 D-alanine--poly(phosphoribitol) ligase subunit DltC [Lactobacillus delbrueckii subsp. lactis]MCD5494613.1 D-alanine--poly(phosphoribitol) ligase subunit DltC [Lactobacillus delbrueckii subsp. lactis]MCD5516635.1 D-alanine--poly(phosphoribitol) ligase subunit DltC [Lactobacillus delbrueckii subsp
MDIQKQIVDILAEATGEDFSDNMDQELYESGIMDSMSTVQMLLTLQETFDITVPVSEFNRDDWNTPNKLVEQVKKLQDEE